MQRRGARALLFLAIFGATAVHSGAPAAMDFKLLEGAGKNRILLLTGEISSNDAARLKDSLRQAKAQGKVIDEVWLNSPGGSLKDGMAMGELLRGNGLVTRIPRDAVCASACNHVFVGGPIRYVDAKGKFCLHMFTASGSRELRAATAKNPGEALRAVEQNSAQVGDLQRKYFKAMGISPRLNDLILQVSNRDIGCLSPRLLVDLNIVNGP